ncbi:MAG TPA: hypothetical protein VHT75_06050 [Acidimicrobiales bacterium]|nr:hypothetical protein [Acidimicrobiales bacterium]
MALGDILDGAIKLLRANARTMAILVGVFMVPFQFGLAFLQRNFYGGNGFLQTLQDPTAASSQNSTGSVFSVLALSYVVFWVAIPLVCIGASRVVMASYLGSELGAKDALRAVVRHLPAALAATLVVHLAEVVSLLGLGVGIVFAMPLFMMTAPAMSLEELGPIAAIRRSVGLARRRYWPTVGIALLSGLLAYILDRVLGLIPNVVALVIGLHWGWLIVAVSGAVQAFVTVSLISIVATLVYLDARIRQEGLDIDVMASKAGLR